MRVGDGDSVSADVMSDMISSSVLYAESGDPAFTQEEILEGDSDMVLKLFQAVQNVTSVEDASKN